MLVPLTYVIICYLLKCYSIFFKELENYHFLSPIHHLLCLNQHFSFRRLHCMGSSQFEKQWCTLAGSSVWALQKLMNGCSFCSTSLTCLVRTGLWRISGIYAEPCDSKRLRHVIVVRQFVLMHDFVLISSYHSEMLVSTVSLRGVTMHKNNFVVFTTVRTSNLTPNVMVECLTLVLYIQKVLG